MGSHLLTFISGGSLVDIDGTLFIQLALFLCMFVFLYLALFRPMIRLIEARRDAIEGTRGRAQDMMREAETFTKEIQKQVVLKALPKAEKKTVEAIFKEIDDKSLEDMDAAKE